MYASSCALNGAVPEMVPELASGALNGINTDTLVVVLPGPWMCAPVAGESKFVKVMLYVSALLATVIKPDTVPGETVGGTSEAPLRFALNCTGLIWPRISPP